MLDGGRVGQAAVGAAQRLGDVGVAGGEALDVHLVDDRLVQRPVGAPVGRPVEERVVHHATWRMCGAAVVVVAGRSGRRARRRTTWRCGLQRAVDRLGVRVEEQLGRVAAVALARAPRARGRGSRSAGPGRSSGGRRASRRRRPPSRRDRAARRRRRRTGTGRRPRPPRRTARSSCRHRRRWRRAGSRVPGQTSSSSAGGKGSTLSTRPPPGGTHTPVLRHSDRRTSGGAEHERGRANACRWPGG